MRACFAALLIVLTAAIAAIAAVPAGAQVEGRYHVATINGHRLPSDSFGEPNLVVKRGLAWFEPDGRFNMSILSQQEDEQDIDHVSGTWKVAADTILVTHDHDDVPRPTYRWAQDGDTLRLYSIGYAYALVRAPATIPGEPWSPGAWQAVRVNGQAVPAPWPLDPEVTLTHMSFSFGPGGQASVRMAGTQEGESMDETSKGRYTVKDDRLTILDDDGTVDEEFLWAIRGGTLELLDARGFVYVFARP